MKIERRRSWSRNKAIPAGPIHSAVVKFKEDCESKWGASPGMMGASTGIENVSRGYTSVSHGR